MTLGLGALALGAALGFATTGEPAAAEHLNPLEWYPTSGDSEFPTAPLFTRLPEIPVPEPEGERLADLAFSAAPLGPLQPFRPAAAKPEDPLESLAFAAAPLGPRQPLAPSLAYPVASFRPEPLGPARGLERPVEEPPSPPRPPASPVFVLVPLGPPQRLQLAAAYPKTLFGPDPLGPPQRLQLAAAYRDTPLSRDPLGPLQPLARWRPVPVADLGARPLGPPQSFQPNPADRRATPAVAAATLTPTLLGKPQTFRQANDSPDATSAPVGEPSDGPARGQVSPAPEPETARDGPRALATKLRAAGRPSATLATGSLPRGRSVFIKNGMVVLRVRY